jgi:hypothetical protein
VAPLDRRPVGLNVLPESILSKINSAAFEVPVGGRKSSGNLTHAPVFTNREHVVALEARDKGLMSMLLRYPYEVRDAAEYFDDTFKT